MSGDDYQRLFNVRGRQYDRAMTRHPKARDHEFSTAVNISGVSAGDRVADIPCGGGYLARYLPADVTLYSVDSSDVFADCLRAAGGHHQMLCPIDQVPLADSSLDHILSLAGLHHVADRQPFWRECARLLRPGGVLTVGDVAHNSRVALFLDSLVDRYTSTGHAGIYFDAQTVVELESCGFDVERVETRRIHWWAENRVALAEFCHSLFGLEGIETATLEAELAVRLGIHDTSSGAELDWELIFFRAVRRQDVNAPVV